MNRFVLALCIILLAALVSFGQGQVGKSVWKDFVSSPGRFKATFPGIPNQSVDKKSNLWVFQVSTADRYFAVSYLDLQFQLPTTREQLKTLYDTGRDGALEAANLKFKGERDIWLNKRLGREFTGTKNNLIGTSRMFIVGKRLYQVTVVIRFPVKEEDKKAADKFLDSFQLTGIKVEKSS